MSRNPLPDFIYGGTSKAASSWIYNCLYSHPEVRMPETDTVEYFDINYHRSEDWYREFFTEYEGEKVVGEASTAYLESRTAAKRIERDMPEVKLLFCLRNPAERAYSHWWHGYGNGYHTYEFKDIFQNYPQYSSWIEPGYYAHHLSKFEQKFPEEQIKVVFFDDLVEDDLSFIQDIFRYVGVNDGYVPPQIDEKSNEADAGGNLAYLRARDWIRKNTPKPVKNTLKVFWDPVRDIVESEDEYEKGMGEDIRRQLEEIYIQDIRKLSAKTDRDFSHWFEYEDF